MAAATETTAGSITVRPPTVNLSFSSFESQCRTLAAVYPTFTWRPPISRFHSDTGFLHCTRQQLHSTTVTARQWPMATDDELQMAIDIAGLELHELDELNVVPAPTSSSLTAPSAAVWCEWHVVYSTTYRVPVLLFQLTFADGQPLDDEQVMQAIASHTDGRTSSLLAADTRDAELPPVSCISHPALCRPFYCLHPCQTAHVMALLQSESTTRAISECSEGALNVLAWLSAIGPFVGLRLTFNSALQLAIVGKGISS